MRRPAKPPVHALLPLLMLAAILTSTSRASEGGHAEQPVLGALQNVRSFATAPHGVPRPSALAWSDGLGGLVLTGMRGGRTVVSALLADETRIGQATLEASGPMALVAENPLSGTVDVLTERGLLSLSAHHFIAGSRLVGGPVSAPSAAGATGATYGASGQLHVLADGAVRVEGEPALTLPTPYAGHDLRGLTIGGEPDELVAYDATDDVLLVLRGGRVSGRIDAADADLHDVRGLTYGPSADPTDDASMTSVYLLDAGGPGEPAEIVEATTHADLTPVAAVVDLSISEDTVP